MKTKKRLLTPDEVAEMLHIARKTMVIMARKQRIPCIRIGRLVRFDQKDIDRWIDNPRSQEREMNARSVIDAPNIEVDHALSIHLSMHFVTACNRST